MQSTAVSSAKVSFAPPGKCDDFWRVDFHSWVGAAGIQCTADPLYTKTGQQCWEENFMKARTQCILYMEEWVDLGVKCKKPETIRKQVSQSLFGMLILLNITDYCFGEQLGQLWYFQIQ